MKYKQNPQLRSGKVYSSLLFAVILIFMLTGCGEKGKKGSDAVNPVSSGKGYTDTSNSFVKVFDQNGKVCIQQSNTYYETVNLSYGKEKASVLLKIRKTELCYADSVNKDKVFDISAMSVSPGKNINWHTSFLATSISYADNTILAVKEGGDIDHDFFRRFSLENGNEVFSCSFSDLEVKIPDVTNKFFLGYTSKRAASNPLGQLKTENLLGVVRFGSSTQGIDSFTVKLKRSKVTGKLSDAVPALVMVSSNESALVIDDGRTIALIRANAGYQPTDIQGFSVKFTFFYGDDNEQTDIIVPVINEKLDIAHATYDKDIFEIGGF